MQEEKSRRGRGLDFGCGAGRLTFAMAKYAKEVVGVDVAEGMLRVARERIDVRKIRNVELRTTLPAEQVDWINSLIVFQHIPPRAATRSSPTSWRSSRRGDS